jgi:hypothetical protein
MSKFSESIDSFRKNVTITPPKTKPAEAKKPPVTQAPIPTRKQPMP